MGYFVFEVVYLIVVIFDRGEEREEREEEREEREEDREERIGDEEAKEERLGSTVEVGTFFQILHIYLKDCF